jgi:vitamin B12 transporter
MYRFSVLFVAVFATLGANAHADEPQVQPTVQVTASRVAETVDQTLADVSVITRQQIDASVARDVLDVLRLEAGVELYRTGGPGQQTSLFLRGTNPNQVLVLIDGVRAASTNTGQLALEQLPLDTVERIEIVRGPRASYWGSDAIGGVIQIFTRKLEGPRVAVGYGTYRDADGSAGLGHWNGADGYSVQVGARHVGGFSPTNPGICNGPSDPNCPYDGDNDGYRNTNLAARAAYTLGTELLSAALFRNQGQVQFDQGFSNIIEQTAGVSLEGELDANWSHRLSLGDAREDLNTPTDATLYLSRRTSLLWQNEIRLDDNQHVVAGIDLVHEHGETRDTSTDLPQYRDSRDDRALFAGWRGTFGAFDSEISGRHDDNSEFGGANTGSLALGWRINDLLRLYANVGQGFRSPTLNEQFSPGYSGYFAGNPDLRPERSRSSELGLEFAPSANQRIKANLYSTRVRDLIDFVGPQNQAENVSRAKIDGAELSYQVSQGPWSARASYTWSDPRNEDTDSLLLRRARQKVSGVLERRFGERFSAGTEIVYASRRADYGGVNLGAYALVNLRARYELNRAWSLSARLENLANRDYELVHGYNTPGRSGFLDVVWQPD